MLPTVTDAHQRGSLAQFLPIDSQPTQRVPVPSPMMAEEEADPTGPEIWGEPPPTVPVASQTPEHYGKIKRYMALNLQSGFAPPDVMNLAQAYAESLVLGPTFLSLHVSADALDEIATMLNQAARELYITPAQRRMFAESKSDALR